MSEINGPRSSETNSPTKSSSPDMHHALPYYSYNNLLSRNGTFNFVVGGRGLGLDRAGDHPIADAVKVVVTPDMEPGKLRDCAAVSRHGSVSRPRASDVDKYGAASVRA